MKPRIRELDVIQLMTKDSADMVDEDWTASTEGIAKLVPHYHGIVVVLGTDTTDRVGTAITFGLQGLAALRREPAFITTPIALGTSQQPLGDYQSDAELQIQDAVASVIKASDNRVSEVMIPAGHDSLHRAVRSSKVSEDKFYIHGSFSYPPIGRIRATAKPLELDGIQFTRYAEFIPRLDNLLELSALPHVQASFRGGIESIALNGLGSVGARLAMVEHTDCTGIVIYTHGAGNGPFSNPKRSIIPVIELATTLGKPVLLTTSIYGGKVNPSIYEAGKVLEQAGGITTFDMTPAAAEVKLAWLMALPEFTSGGIAFIKDIFTRDLVGEKGDPDLVTA